MKYNNPAKQIEVTNTNRYPIVEPLHIQVTIRLFTPSAVYGVTAIFWFPYIYSKNKKCKPCRTDLLYCLNRFGGNVIVYGIANEYLVVTVSFFSHQWS